MAGQVYAGDRRIDKPGAIIPTSTSLTLRGSPHPWVSRGGVKLAHGLDHFGFTPAGRICIDIGASTGGFTDVLLSRGAVLVHAVDVGHGQLAWKLRQDPRVIVHEKTNARTLDSSLIADPIQSLVCDASFIGLRTVLPASLALCTRGAFAVALIKPQFEAGRQHVGKGGVVREAAVRQEVVAMILTWWQNLPGWRVIGVTESPITGPEGNVEFLIGAVRE